MISMFLVHKFVKVENSKLFFFPSLCGWIVTNKVFTETEIFFQELLNNTFHSFSVYGNVLFFSLNL